MHMTNSVMVKQWHRVEGASARVCQVSANERITTLIEAVRSQHAFVVFDYDIRSQTRRGVRNKCGARR